MKLYAIDADPRQRMVLARNQRDAAELLGVSVYYLTTYGIDAAKPFDLTMIPRKVYTRYRGQSWKEVQP